MFVERVCIPPCGWETFPVLLSSRKEMWQPHKVASFPVEPSLPCCPWCGPGLHPPGLPGVPVTRMDFHPCLQRVKVSQKLCFIFFFQESLICFQWIREVMNFKSRGFNSVLTIMLYQLKKKKLLDYSWFAMLCWFLLYNKVYQLHIYIYPLFHILFPIGHCRVLRTWRAPVLCSRSLLVIYFIHSSMDMSISTSQFIPPTIPPW